MHRIPQLKFAILLAKKNEPDLLYPQIEPGSLKNLTAQLKEGAAVARPLRPQCFGPGFASPLVSLFFADVVTHDSWSG